MHLHLPSAAGRLAAAATALAAVLLAPDAIAASFDCKAARSPLEKLICSVPELDAADARMGAVFARAKRDFPLPGFVVLSQRQFLAEYPDCLRDEAGHLAPREAARRRCLDVVGARTAQLERYAGARVYSDATGAFTVDNLAILVYADRGQQRILLWGNWMPDAYRPLPFPEGKLCLVDEALQPGKKGGQVTETGGDVEFRIAEDSVAIDGFISCTPRNGIAPGKYRRFR